jgi:hypothetical protein
MRRVSTSTDASDLGAVWSSAARRATDAQLAVCVVVAVVAALVFGIGLLVSVRRVFPWWPLVAPALAAGTFGVWGIADRELREKHRRHWSRRALAAAKMTSAVAAGIVAGLVAIGVLRFTIGTWIS